MRYFVILCLITFCARALESDHSQLPASANLALQTLNQNLSKASQSPLWLKLLHFGNHTQIRSDFFLSQDGGKNPHLELEAFLKMAFQDFIHAKNSVICSFPARATFLANQIKASQPAEKIIQDFARYLGDFSKCTGLNQFRRIVPIDEIYLEFAAESDLIPGSSMGHLYLLLQGRQKEEIHENLGYDILQRKKGEIVEYALSYYAILSRFFNPLDYFNAFFGNLKGSFTLNPYANVKEQYFNSEKRNIYRFKIHTDQESLTFFTLHLWELKDKNINYSFITYNCVDAISSILAILTDNLHTFKPFITPIEYLQMLEKHQWIRADEMVFFSSKNRGRFIQKFGENEIFDSIKPSKIALDLSLQGFGSLYFAPIYSDLKDVNFAYKEFIESRMASLSIGFEPSRIFIRRIELLHLHSILDFPTTKSLSKLISMRLEGNVFQNMGRGFSSSLNHKTRLFPTLDLGLGLGKYLGTRGVRAAVFTQAILGARYELLGNIYAGAKAGIILSTKHLRILGNGVIFYDFIANNRGYDALFESSIAYKIRQNWQVFSELGLYFNVFDPKIRYEASQAKVLKIGVSFNF